jgi:hypothetical protein
MLGRGASTMWQWKWKKENGGYRIEFGRKTESLMDRAGLGHSFHFQGRIDKPHKILLF